MPSQNDLLIVWWSRTGAAKALAKACHDAAREEFETGQKAAGTTAARAEVAGTLSGQAGKVFRARMVRCDEVSRSDLLSAGGLVFACPENLASMAGMMKEFFDVHYYAALGQLNGRAYATLISAGSDGTGAARQIQRIATGWRLREMAGPVICNVDAQTPEAIQATKILSEAQLAPARALGQAFAAALVMGVY